MVMLDVAHEPCMLFVAVRKRIACDVRSVCCLHHVQYALYACIKMIQDALIPSYVRNASRNLRPQLVRSGLCSGTVHSYIFTQHPATPYIRPCWTDRLRLCQWARTKIRQIHHYAGCSHTRSSVLHTSV